MAQQSCPASTAAPEFQEFSYWDKDGFLTGYDVSETQRLALRTILLQHYNATDLLECFPFVVIGCEGGPPSEEHRPFSIAGAVAIWRDAEDFHFKPLVGDLGQGDEIDIDPAMVDRMVRFEVPPREVFTYLANDAFPQCEAISVLWQMLVVELPATSKHQHLVRLEDFPSTIIDCPLILRFHNGPLPNSERRGRDIQLKSKPLENKFMGMEAARTFLRSDQQNMGDLYIFDSSATGKQNVFGFGRRFTLSQTQSYPNLAVPQDGQNTMPVNNGAKYIALERSVFATNSPEIFGKPQTHDSACRSVLLRCRLAEPKRKKDQTEKAALEQGEIGGMLHFCDLQSKPASKAEDHIMYADSFDPLIDAGWTIDKERNGGLRNKRD
ncbi:hypothetical protein ACHAPT_011720 [Fusarium lateritium]